MISNKETESRITLSVNIVLSREIDRSKKWAIPEWQIAAVSIGAPDDIKSPSAAKIEKDIVYFSYSALSLQLFKDGSEGYWYNLLSDQPYLFVICEGEQGDQEITPIYVTVNQDEATGHLESDDIVLSTPMPAEMRELLERYVVDHYQPQQKRKRKRKDWVEDSLYMENKNV